MAGSKDGSSIFWLGVVIAGMVYVISDSFAVGVVVAVVALLLIWVLKGANNRLQQAQEGDKEYSFDFDALSPAYKSHLLQQQFGYFFNFITTSSGNVDFYCSEDKLDGYRFSFWVDYLIQDSSSTRVVKVKKGDPICTVYISSNKGKASGYEKFTIYAPINGVVVNFLKGTLQKGVLLFRVKKGDDIAEVVDVDVKKIVDSPKELPQQKPTIRFEDVVVEDLSMPDTNIEVEDLDDVLRWDMPTVDDIDEVIQENIVLASDPSLSHHATITNLSDFDWCDFKAVCYLSNDAEQKEVRLLGNVKIGEKTLLSSNYDMFYLEGQDKYGVKKRFRPFGIEKHSDITVTTIFIEHH